MRLLLGTSNPGKVQEAAAALAGLALEFLTPPMLALTVQPEETGHTFAENALLKARAFHAFLITASAPKNPAGSGR